ncbi:S-adenosylmethionine mitochondrial carrier protein [Amphibalanus amphitrite]|uniref:S-adenosylmethionine mitochondrial carrier protein n=1 Tax=Amphibalanus amphitrite TaxID=1232801 RepID=A0A6A4W1J0_AMPAM|nr:S-adenosylmethionine mitochondrial carrier protein [Amphibalanus amphitrite]
MSDTRFRLGPAESDEKVRCDEPDSAKHLLVDYPAYQGPRTRPWGPLPTLREILSTEAGLIRDFLVETGQVTRDDMLKKKKKKKHRPEDATESVFSEDESESLPVAAVVRVPVEVVKQRRQARPDISARHIISTTLAEEGFAGMYRGFLTTVLREVPFAILQLPLWEALKAAWGRQRGRPVEPWQSGLCGGVAGGVSAAVTTPLDVAKTRIMLADRHSQLASGGLVAALRIIRQENGFAGLFAGVVPRVLWISTGGSVFFGSYSLVMRLIS